MFGLEPGRGFESPDKQIADDHRMIDQLGLASLVYDWGNGEQGQSLTFRMEHHAWELYGLPQEADAVARATLARTTQRHSHWLVEWPGRDRVLLRRPHLLEVPVLRGWTRVRRQGDLDRRVRDAAATVARLDERLERHEVLEPLYVERTQLGGQDWKRTVALLSGGGHVAMFPCDWYAFIVSDFLDSCSEAVQRDC